MAELNWNNICALNGSRARGFEQLCVQLAGAETSDAAEFRRKGTPDSGVECYRVLPDGTEWGWQAKFFTSALTSSQWSQLDDSVKKALTGHPNLARYYVCIPHDRSDARIPTRKSEKDRWDDHVKKWKSWARDRAMDVELVWWGASELLERLSRPEHAGRRFFWFEFPDFHQGWFQSRLDEAIRAAGPRYTPELHVDLPIAQDLEMFERSEGALGRIKSRAIPISRVLGNVRFARRAVEEAGQSINLDEVIEPGQAILDAIKALSHAPDRELPITGIVERINETESAMRQGLDSIRALESAENTDAEGDHSGYHVSPLERLRGWLGRLSSELSDAREFLDSAAELANKSVLILSGPAGVGKTHLLCDFAERRVAAGAPTVLLMGQRFLASEGAWPQALKQLDMGGTTAEVFVGALEAAAQAANVRALFIVDALNEGQGSLLWPVELAPFLTRLEESPWIGVVLSARTPHESTLIPEAVRNGAAEVQHDGFGDQEYDAVRSFFKHYDLELPSAPILSPEFRNPLFLKTICKGLQASGQRRLPTGFQGISAVFDLYLTAINEDLAKRLDFDPQKNLVRVAMRAVAGRTAETEHRRLPRTEAQELVDEFLPGRDYSKSLYAALVSEDILSEDVDWWSGSTQDRVTYVSYERLTDHLIADHLLQAHLDSDDPQKAFAEQGGLAFMREPGTLIPVALIEALCVQVPERTGKELARFAPELLERPDFGFVFLNSIVWRSLDAFTDDTRNVLNELAENGQLGSDEVLDSLLIVATAPGHPFNARFIDARLRRDSMPERDSWWSTYLHDEWQDAAWRSKGAIYRLVDWASGLSDTSTLEDEVIDLASITLAWTFSTPNRYLRDRATKAMVTLLTGRFDAAGQLVEQFADVDDPYVAERVYAVAYGVAMRSRDTAGVALLASIVYEKMFASGSPPAHVLLRDYARGVIERAIHLGADIAIDEGMIRPPYKSAWPDIPSEEDVAALFPGLGGGAYDGGDLEWSRNRIRYSVTGGVMGDFGNYVIGGPTGLPWLSLRLGQKPWQLPSQRVNDLVQIGSEGPPRFDVSAVQRYIQWRVFDLGWTIERFGAFDRFRIESSGRHAGKPERIGKKYQWIAYHEILAYLADHFQYYGRYGEGQRYEGPWQLHVRDIDPSSTLRDTPGGTGWTGHTPAWWGEAPYTEWGAGQSRRDWIEDKEGIPSVESFIRVVRPEDGSHWINLDGFYLWREPRPADVDPHSVAQRELWLKCVAYIGGVAEIEAFVDSSQNAVRRGRSLPEALSILPQDMFLGEYGWAPAFRHLSQSDDTPPDWNDLDREDARVFAATHLAESGGFDCSLDDTYSIALPHPDLLETLGIRWSGSNGDYLDESDQLAAFDPTVYEDGPSAMLIREDLLRKYLEARGMTLCWIVSGEKWAVGGDIGSRDRSRLVISGAYKLTDSGPQGSVSFESDP